MFIRASTVFFSLAVLAGFASAVPNSLVVRETCNSGTMQCCNNVQNADSHDIVSVFNSLGLPVPAGGTQVGVSCSPFNSGGQVSGGTCIGEVTCCDGTNTGSGVLIVNCNPTINNY